MMHIFYQLYIFSLFNSSTMSHKAFIAGMKFERSGGLAEMSGAWACFAFPITFPPCLHLCQVHIGHIHILGTGL